jgi:hypothetical protein
MYFEVIVRPWITFCLARWDIVTISQIDRCFPPPASNLRNLYRLRYLISRRTYLEGRLRYWSCRTDDKTGRENDKTNRDRLGRACDHQTIYLNEQGIAAV